MIRILSEITPELAKAFRIICSMAIGILPLKKDGSVQESVKRIIVPYKNNKDKLGEWGLSFRVLNELETLGVIKFQFISDYICTGINNDNVLIYVDKKLEVINEYKKGEIPAGNVMLTSVGESLQAITDSCELEGYYEMIMNYFSRKKIKLANKHGYVANQNGDEVIIRRTI